MEGFKGEECSAFKRELEGKYGKYILGEKLGRGGNGDVYDVTVISEEDMLPSDKEFVIKFLRCFKDPKIYEQRLERFKKEVEYVLEIQENVDGIIPIYDSSFFSHSQEGEGLEWYLMPKASEYCFGACTVEEKLRDMRDIGECLLQIHSKGFAHRDIKPKNLLIYKGRVCLSDFGLVCNTRDSNDHITREDERIGPWALRPPEMRNVGGMKNVDYQKSDVYLFAKMVWIILTGRVEGFEGEYQRVNRDIYLDKNVLQIETIEPLHEMMESATSYLCEDRIDMTGCVQLMNVQLDIIFNASKIHVLNDWKYMEAANEIYKVIPEGSKTYFSPQQIYEILNKLSGIVALVFEEMGEAYEPLVLNEIRIMSGDIFELDVRLRKNKRLLRISIENIIMDHDLMCELHTKEIAEDELERLSRIGEKDLVFTNLREVFQSEEPCIYINENYTVRILRLDEG